MRHNGKPLILIWGVGFNDNRKYSIANVDALVTKLKGLNNDESILLGVPYYWRTFGRDTENNPALHALIKKCDILLPWAVGRDKIESYDSSIVAADVKWAEANGVDYVTSENDVLAKRKVPQPVGMGSYAMDSHNVQRYVTSEGFVQDEGDIGVDPKAPYSISYGSIIPKKEECSNLLVPVCLSSSHIAYGSIRMEPVFMILGQSAAVAACIAIDKKLTVQNVPYD